MTERTRAVDVSLVLDASPDEVWDALSDPQELTRWFPIEARVEPGVGGSVTWRWDDQFTTVARIDAWEPRRRLRLMQDREPRRAADGSPLPDAARAEMAIDFLIETADGRTRLRVVHAGFGHSDAWDDEVEGVTIGWKSAFCHLGHYLARHRGRKRHVGWTWATTGLSHAETWQVLTADGGFSFGALRPPATGPFALTTPSGDVLSGVVQLHVVEREWVGSVRELDDGLLRLSTWRGDGRTGMNVSISTWQAAHVAWASAFEEAAKGFLNERFTRSQP